MRKSCDYLLIIYMEKFEMVKQKKFMCIMQSGNNCTILGVHLIWKQKIWLILTKPNCLLANHNPEFALCYTWTALLSANQNRVIFSCFIGSLFSPSHIRGRAFLAPDPESLRIKSTKFPLFFCRGDVDDEESKRVLKMLQTSVRAWLLNYEHEKIDEANWNLQSEWGVISFVTCFEVVMLPCGLKDNLTQFNSPMKY